MGQSAFSLRDLFVQRWFFVVMLLLFLFLLGAFAREELQSRRVERLVGDLESEARMLEDRNEEIARLSAELSSRTFLEEEARQRLGLAKPGERVVILSSPDEDPPPLTDIGAPKIEERIALQGFPLRPVGRWRLYFFDHARFEELRIEERGT